jgi:glutamine synthetase
MTSEQLKASGTRFLRILWCDNANIIRGRALHITNPDLQRGTAISRGQQAVPVMFDSVIAESGLGPVGEVQLRPAWETLTTLPYCPGHAQVLGEMFDGEVPWAHCPRNFLKTQLRRLGEYDLTLQVAFENEFFLLKRSDDGIAPADTSLYAMTQALNQHAAYIDALVDCLEQQGIASNTWHAESGPGQLELSVRPAKALRAADQQIIFRETARAVAQRHGYIASFLPKPFEGAAGSGCHLNISLWREGTNLTGGSAGLGEAAQQFIAGILTHQRALAALTLASRNSYRRIAPHAWAGAFTCWGYGNREASIRVSEGRFELKAVDGSANPYLALGAVIAAGLDGLARRLPLPAPVDIDPGLYRDEERSALGIAPLPETLIAALDTLESDAVLIEALGTERARAYLAVKRAEWQALQDYSTAQELELLAERY